MVYDEQLRYDIKCYDDDDDDSFDYNEEADDDYRDYDHLQDYDAEPWVGD